MSNPVPQTEDDVAVVIYESPGSKYSVITAVENAHGGRIQVAVIRLREPCIAACWDQYSASRPVRREISRSRAKVVTYKQDVIFSDGKSRSAR